MAFFNGSAFERVSDLVTLVTVHLGQHFDFAEEIVVLVAFLAVSVLHDVVEGFTVKGKEHRFGLGFDTGSTGSVVQKREFSERLASDIGLQVFIFAVFFEFLGAVKLTAVDDIKDIAIVALVDDHLIGFEGAFDHGIDHGFAFSDVQSTEHERLLKALFDVLAGFVGFRIHDRCEFFFLVKLSIDFGTD